MTNRFVQ